MSEQQIAPTRCWTCGAEMGVDLWTAAPQEPEPHGDKRTCEDCHYRIEAIPNALAVMNMVRYAAGLPIVECLDCDGAGCRLCGWRVSGSSTQEATR